MSIRSNPIVFVSLGQEAFWPALSDALREYAGEAGYINASGGLSEEKAKAEVNRVWRDFLQEEAGLADVIRINYLLGPDEANLPALREQIEKYFHALYPGILTDAYCLLDDANLLDGGEGRGAVLDMLREEQAKGLRVYLLSNLTSVNVFIPQETTAKTIALLTLFKDCVPDVYVVTADASRYNEFFFIDNCFSRHGSFLTAGSLNLAVPRDALKALIMAELLSHRGDSSLPPLPLPPYESRPAAPTKSLDYLLGLAIPDVNRVDPLTREKWIARLFGERLEQLEEQAENAESLCLENLSDEIFNANFFDLFRAAVQDKIYKQEAGQATGAAGDELRKAEERFKKWLAGRPNFAKGSTESAKRRLSPFVNQDLWPYTLASDYLRKRQNLRALRARVHAMEAREELTERFCELINTYGEEVQAAIASYEKQAKPLDDAFSAFMPRFTDYFRQKFKEYAAENEPRILELSKEMPGFLRRGEFPAYLRRLDEYITDVLASEHFNEPIMDILQKISRTDESLASAMSEWVMRHRHFNIRLKTGYSALYTETNLFMPVTAGPRSSIAADVKKHYESRGLGRLNLFAKANADHVSVLYHAGAFGPEDLYYG